MSASIWAPGGELLVNSSNKIAVEHFIVSDINQPTFTLTNFTYVLGTNSISVYLNGVMQRSGVDYSESSDSTITFLSHTFVAGDVVSIVGQTAVTSGSANPFGTSIQSFIATTGQTTFPVTHINYIPNNGSLRVYINGLLQEAGDSYQEVNGNIVFSEGLEAGDEVLASFNSEIGISQQAAYVSYIAAGTDAVATDVQSKLREFVSVKDFGAKGDGITDDTAAFSAAIDYLKIRGGGTLYIPHGRYLLIGSPGADGIINGVVLPFTAGSDTGATATSINLIGEDRDTTLLAGSNNMIVVRCSTSYSDIGCFQILANGKTGVQGIALIPENISSPSTTSQQSFNSVRDFYISACAEGVVLQCGGNGGAYYNHIGPGHIHGSGLNGTRGVYLKTGAAGAVSPPNRNHFVSVRVGSTNTGFEIEAGDTNKFTGCSVEGITAGSNPSATPTGLIVRNTDNNTPVYSNQGNMFFGFVAEACTQDALILNSRTMFFGFVLHAFKTTLASDFVSSGNGTMIGSYDVTVFPNIYAGTIEYRSQLPSGIGSYEYGAVRNNSEYFDNGYKYKSFGLTTSNVGNVQSINEAKSYYTKLAGMVDWSFRFQFLPTANNSVITVPLPVTASLKAYATYSLMPPFVFLVRIAAGASEVVGFAEVNYESPAGTYLKIRLPSGTTWNMSGNYNSTHGQIRYRAA